MIGNNVVQFTRPMMVTNAACCSDPRVMCERCAAAALNAGRSYYPELDDSPLLIPPTMEAPKPERSFVANVPDDALPLPNLMEQIVNERRAEQAKGRRKREQPVVNITDDDMLVIPVIDWTQSR